MVQPCRRENALARCARRVLPPCGEAATSRARRAARAGTRLFDAGEVALAQTVQEEATRLLRSGSTSDEGRKRIKFGTRGLMGRDSVDERETGT